MYNMPLCSWRKYNSKASSSQHGKFKQQDPNLVSIDFLFDRISKHVFKHVKKEFGHIFCFFFLSVSSFLWETPVHNFYEIIPNRK